MSWISKESFQKHTGHTDGENDGGLPILKEGTLPLHFYGVHHSNEDMIVLHPLRSDPSSPFEEEVSVLFFTKLALIIYQQSGPLDRLKIRGIRVPSKQKLPVCRVFSKTPLPLFIKTFLSFVGEKVETSPEENAHVEITTEGYLRTDNCLQLVYGQEGGDFSFSSNPSSKKNFQLLNMEFEHPPRDSQAGYCLIQTPNQNRIETFLEATARGEMIISILPTLPDGINPSAVIRDDNLESAIRMAMLIRNNPETSERFRNQSILLATPEQAWQQFLKTIEPEQQPHLSEPFNSDPVIAMELERLISELDIEVVIETGTYHGTTSTWFAKRVSEVHTVEVVPENFQVAQQYLGRLENVRQYLGSSEIVLKNFLAQMISRTAKPVMFYLDAHWQNFWPLLDEIRVIAGVCPNRCVIVIDDFQVPDRDYQFDCYHQQPNNWEFVKEVVHQAMDEPVYWYNGRTERPGRGVGKFVCVPKQLFRESWVQESNGVKYSTI